MTDQDSVSPKTDRLAQTLRVVLTLVGFGFLVLLAWLGHAYITTPKAIRYPSSAHYHFRLQIINDGQAVNFAEEKFQTDFNKDMCTAALTEQPIHFHDNLDQFVHIHWGHITGGILLKNFGWNFVGGTSRTLGYRFDQFPKITRVGIHGHDLPKPPSGAHYYIYTGDEHNFQEQNWDDFLRSDLHDFLTGKPTASLLERLVPAASAHQDDATEAKLAKLNDVLGNIVIFVQKNPPSDTQVKDRFNKLIDLPESSCSG